MSSYFGNISMGDFRILNHALGGSIIADETPPIDYNELARVRGFANEGDARRRIRRIFGKLQWFNKMPAAGTSNAYDEGYGPLTREEFETIDPAMQNLTMSDRPQIDYEKLVSVTGLKNTNCAKERVRQVFRNLNWYRKNFQAAATATATAATATAATATAATATAATATAATATAAAVGPDNEDDNDEDDSDDDESDDDESDADSNNDDDIVDNDNDDAGGVDNDNDDAGGVDEDEVASEEDMTVTIDDMAKEVMSAIQEQVNELYADWLRTKDENDFEKYDTRLTDFKNIRDHKTTDPPTAILIREEYNKLYNL